ncbi:arylsulfatase [Niabella sp.]|uniref:arylsulfatase n=1 Tax=Niabella sp. TaxID=1962976 RepID=UPI002624AD02|nr:arylsulfatase [Niabella sp.]
MKRRILLILSGCFMSLLCPAMLPGQQDAGKGKGKPNILLICADDLGWSDIGCYGSEVKTPNLDLLAAQGVRFRQFHNTSKCHPSRATLLTGLYAQQNGYAKKFDGPIVNGITLGEYLKSAGYITLWSGKHHGAENPKTRGFDHYYGLRDGASNYFNPGLQRPGEGKPAHKKVRYWCIEDKEYHPYTPEEKDFYTTDYFTNYALKWLDDYKNDEAPFFLYLAYNAPHDPLMAWPEDIAKYKGKYDKGYEAIRNARFKKQQQTGLIDSRYRLSDATYRPWKSLSAAERETEARKMEVYAAMIDRMDQNIGRVLRKLKEQGKYENTLIIFLSDNGASAEVVTLDDSYGPIGTVTNWTSLGADWANIGNTPFRYFKNYSYEGGTAAPMIVSWKNGLKTPARISDFTGHLIDVMATFVDLAAVPYPKSYNGKPVLPYEGTSFLPVIQGKTMERKQPLFWEWQTGQAARDGKWKLVKEGLDQPWSLFDMQADPSETKDLAAAQPEVVSRMDQLFKAWKARISIVKAKK